MISKFGFQVIIRIVKSLLAVILKHSKLDVQIFAFRRELNGKPEHVHTLNGSGLAIGRTVAAILEKTTNNQMVV